MNEEIKRYAPPTSRETKSIELIAALDARLTNDRTYLEDRLRMVPDLYRQWRIAETAAAKVVDGLYDTLPPKTMLRMRRLYESGEIVIRPRGGMNKDSDSTVVLSEDIRRLARTVCESECAMCIKTGRDIKKCKLRETLLRVSPPPEVFDDITSLCEYATIWED